MFQVVCWQVNPFCLQLPVVAVSVRERWPAVCREDARELRDKSHRPASQGHSCCSEQHQCGWTPVSKGGRWRWREPSGGPGTLSNLTQNVRMHFVSYHGKSVHHSLTDSEAFIERFIPSRSSSKIGHTYLKISMEYSEYSTHRGYFLWLEYLKQYLLIM